MPALVIKLQLRMEKLIWHPTIMVFRRYPDRSNKLRPLLHLSDSYLLHSAQKEFGGSSLRSISIRYCSLLHWAIIWDNPFCGIRSRLPDHQDTWRYISAL